MASPYFSRHSPGGGSAYFKSGHTGSAYARKGQSHGGGGILGFGGNLLSDIGGAVTGLPEGFKTLGESVVHDVAHHPLSFAYPPTAAKALIEGETGHKVLKPVALSYKQTYGPLTHGDINGFLHQLYEHPLNPILDVATALTGGAGGIAKAGRVLSEAGIVSESSRFAQLGRLGSIELTAGDQSFLKATSRNPVIRARQQGFDRLFKSLDRLYGRSAPMSFPAEIPLISTHARYGRAVRRVSEQKALSTQLLDKRYRKAIRLNKRDILAVNLHGAGVHPADLARLPQFASDAKWAKVLNDPKLAALVDHPPPRIQQAIDEARILSKHGEDLAVGMGFLTPKTAAQRLTLGIRRVEEQLGEKITPLPGERFYVKDVASARKGGGEIQAMRGGGKAPPRSFIHENKNVLHDLGLLSLGEDILGPEFSRRVHVSLYQDLWEKQLAAGSLLEPGQRVPHGWELLRRKFQTVSKDTQVSAEADPNQLLIPGTTGKTVTQTKRFKVQVTKGKGTSERIPAVVKQRAEHDDAMRMLVKDPNDLGSSELAKMGFTTANEAEAEMVGRQYVIVPSSLVKAMTGEFHRSSPVLRLIAKPLHLWRALVLGGRLGFFTNNVVGNTFLYMIHNLGPQGLMALMHRTLSEDQFRRFFPEHLQTFGGTQAVRAGTPTALLGKVVGEKTARRARGLTLGVMPATQAVAETYLRRAAVDAAVRKNPAIRSFYRQMPKETRSFQDAAEHVLSHDPLIQQEISNKVNAALGDYTRLGSFERNVIRQLVPFYAWYRAIFTITVKLAVDTPGRANALSRLGQIGAEITQQQIGPTEDFLKGAVPVGSPKDGYQRILTTGGINPFATIKQETQGAGGLVGIGGSDARKNLLGSLNPFLAGLLNAGASPFGGQPAPGGFLGGAVLPVVENLPQLTLYQRAGRGEFPGKGKATRYRYNRLDAFLAFLGVPLKDLNLAVEHAKANG